MTRNVAVSIRQRLLNYAKADAGQALAMAEEAVSLAQEIIQ
ncbi:MAG: hypothetical protein ACE5I2_13265 [Anaerolineae bacterium]